MKNRTPEDIVGKALGRAIGHIGYYFILKRLGAPKYVAYIATGINSHLANLAEPIDQDELKAAVTELVNRYQR